MSAKRKLLGTFGFWIAVLMPLVVALPIAYLMAKDAGLVWQYVTKERVTFTADFFRVPIWIASLALPLTAVVIANHRSQQAVLAMEISQSQNNFSNYYTHREKFNDRLLALPIFTREDMAVELRLDSSKLYSLIFNESSLSGIQTELNADSFMKIIKIFHDSFGIAETRNNERVKEFFDKFTWELGFNVKFKELEMGENIDFRIAAQLMANIYTVILSGLDFGLTNNSESRNKLKYEGDLLKNTFEETNVYYFVEY